jgi:hypothetical protein
VHQYLSRQQPMIASPPLSILMLFRFTWLLSSEEEAKEAANRPRQPRQQRPQRSERQSNRRDDGPILTALVEKGWDSDQFVEGKVVNVLEFGAFVRVDASKVCIIVHGLG